VYFLSLALAYYFQRHLPLTSKAAVVAMVQAWNPLRPGLSGAWNYPAWSLSVEAFFYLVFPFVFPWLAGRSRRVLLLLLAASLTLCVLLRTPIQGLGDSVRSSTLAFVPLPIIRLPEFLAGIILGIWLLRDDQPSATAARTTRVTLAVLAALVLLSAPIGAWVSLVILPFSVLVYELAARQSWLAGLLSTKTMRLLGGASYSVYLLQYPVRAWVHLIFSQFPTALSSLGAPLTPLILIAFSIAVFLLWEEPSRRALRRWFSPKQVHTPAGQKS
jgi:peptidoglycan/LPS O-acetylase OafA/YrhL